MHIMYSIQALTYTDIDILLLEFSLFCWGLTPLYADTSIRKGAKHCSYVNNPIIVVINRRLILRRLLQQVAFNKLCTRMYAPCFTQ